MSSLRLVRLRPLPIADLRIRTDREGAKRHLRLCAPLHERLRQQGDGGHQKQDPATGACHGLRNAKGREGLTGAARHDELAPVRRGQSGSHRVQGPLLVLAQALAAGAHHDLRGLQAERVPVDRRVEQVLQTNPGDRDGLTRHRLLRSGVPVLRCGHEQPGGELSRPRLRQEGVDVSLGDDARGRVIELALDGAQLAGLALAGHQVDAAVRACTPLRPFAPHPYLVEALGVARVREEELAHQALEGCALASLRPRVEVQAVQDHFDARLTHGEKHTVRKVGLHRHETRRDGTVSEVPGPRGMIPIPCAGGEVLRWRHGSSSTQHHPVPFHRALPGAFG